MADAPVDALLARADELARRWAIALILARPLAEMAEIPLEDLAREAPVLCAQLARALSSDAALERILSGAEPRGREGSIPALRLGALAGARDAKAAVERTEALRGVIWEAALGELPDPSPRQVADLSDRLAFVCAAVLAATLDQSSVESEHDAPRATPAVAREQVLYSSPRSSPGRRGAVLIDEREDVAAPAAPAGRRAQDAERAAAAPAEAPRPSHDPAPERPQRTTGGEPSRTSARPLPWDTPLRAERPERRRPQAAVEDDSQPSGAPAGAEPVVRITRGPGSPVDERA
jgi:hypothetical protein